MAPGALLLEAQKQYEVGAAVTGMQEQGRWGGSCIGASHRDMATVPQPRQGLATCRAAGRLGHLCLEHGGEEELSHDT